MNNRKKKRMKSELRRLKAEMRAASVAEARDNERYAAVLAINTETAKFGRGADRNQLRAIQLKINQLLIERDKINTKLTAYYNASSEQNPDTNYVKMFDKAEHNARRQARNKLVDDKNELYKSRHDIGDGLLKHDKLSNRYIEISGKIGRIDKQLNSGGKITARTRNKLLTERAKLAREQKKLKNKLRVMTGKFKKRAAIAKENRAARIRAFVVLLMLVGVGALCYVYRIQIIDYVKGLLAGWMGGAF